jgi:hypothetical protein
MAEIPRIDVQEARQRAAAGGALLVCAYDDEEKCRQLGLEGAISLARFRSLLPALPQNREVIFYCG